MLFNSAWSECFNFIQHLELEKETRIRDYRYMSLIVLLPWRNMNAISSV